MQARLTKKQIRSRILLKLKNHKEEDREKKSRLIKNRLLRNRFFKKAKVIMFYLSFGGEVKTKEMIKVTQKIGKIVTVPFCRQNRIFMRPCVLTPKARLARGSYGVMQPTQKRFLKINDLDLVIVPGIAFDRQGNRLGRGKGCYDSFLKKLPSKAHSIGLAYDFQILPRVPTTKHDTKVNKVIFA